MLDLDLSRLLPWRWVKLDPARTVAAQTHFNTKGGYDAWHTYCRQEFKRAAGRDASKLKSDGIAVVKCLNAQEAVATKELALAKAEAFASAKKAVNYSDVMKFSNSDFLLPTVTKMLNAEMDNTATDIFGSEYYVHSLMINRTMPSKVSKRSFLWHCDRGPKDFIKINMFLDATSEHGGTTEFLNLQDSAAFEKAGYTFGANARRVADLSGLSRRLKVEPKVIHPQLAAGEAFAFFPARSLHRGFLPTKGIRHMLSIVLLPSPIHWTKAWKATSKTGYHLISSATFPDKASSLFGVLGLEEKPLPTVQ